MAVDGGNVEVDARRRKRRTTNCSAMGMKRAGGGQAVQPRGKAKAVTPSTNQPAARPYSAAHAQTL
jgi:hypothetical protein